MQQQLCSLGVTTFNSWRLRWWWRCRVKCSCATIIKKKYIFFWVACTCNAYKFCFCLHFGVAQTRKKTHTLTHQTTMTMPCAARQVSGNIADFGEYKSYSNFVKQNQNKFKQHSLNTAQFNRTVSQSIFYFFTLLLILNPINNMKVTILLRLKS